MVLLNAHGRLSLAARDAKLGTAQGPCEIPAFRPRKASPTMQTASASDCRVWADSDFGFMELRV